MSARQMQKELSPVLLITMRPEDCSSSPAAVIQEPETSNRISHHLAWRYTGHARLLRNLPGFGRESGTSISAALTAGATALFVNWGLQSDPPRYFTNREIKSLLIRGATRSSNLLYPNREWGYGTLNLYQIFPYFWISKVVFIN